MYFKFGSSESYDISSTIAEIRLTVCGHPTSGETIALTTAGKEEMTLSRTSTSTFHEVL
jgi:hypothetical protein